MTRPLSVLGLGIQFICHSKVDEASFARKKKNEYAKLKSAVKFANEIRVDIKEILFRN